MLTTYALVTASLLSMYFVANPVHACDHRSDCQHMHGAYRVHVHGNGKHRNGNIPGTPHDPPLCIGTAQITECNSPSKYVILKLKHDAHRELVLQYLVQFGIKVPQATPCAAPLVASGHLQGAALNSKK